jgi:hypothetical protein
MAAIVLCAKAAKRSGPAPLSGKADKRRIAVWEIETVCYPFYFAKSAMMVYRFLLIVCLLLFLWTEKIRGQEPHLPPTNLGMSNMQDGKPPSPGWYNMEYIQEYEASTTRGGSGQSIPRAGTLSSILAMDLVTYISKTKALEGNPGFAVMVPIVKLSVSGAIPMPSINANPLGDIVLGPVIQWFDKKLLGMNYSHRLEVDLAIPTGGYQTYYTINPGAHLYRIIPHYTFTLTPTEKLSISMRHHLNYFFKEIGTPVRLGISYNFNYSVEYAITHSFTVEAAGYYLAQLEQDIYDGDSHYYQRMYSISDTRERVFAYGPGIGYVWPSGLFMELKGMQETAVRNRPQGFRATLVLSCKLNK